MRPQAAGSPPAGSPPRRKHSSTNTISSPAASGGPTTFFMASQSMLDAEQTPTVSMSDTTFGVRSLAEDSGRILEDSSVKEDGRRRSTIIASRTLIRDMSKDSLSMGSFASSSSSSDRSSPSRAPQSHAETGAATHQGIPSVFQSATPSISEPSSPNCASVSSFRPSDDDILDDRSSQAVMSDSEDEVQPVPATGSSAIAPQLIMPSIMLPSRRPFSENGSSMGRLRILLAGCSGTGKSSLIKSIVQTCEDIVYIDAVSPIKTRSGRSKLGLHGHNSTKQIIETHASTKAYPSWWSDLEESKVVRRRSGGDGTVLERNVCFVDTPGYDSGISVLESIDNVMQYIDTQASAAFDVTNLDSSNLLHLLGGSGGTQVDVVLYLLAHPVKPADLEFMKQLSTMSNVIPLLARADTLAADQVEHIRASMSEALTAAEIKTFPLSQQHPAHHVYTVCSSPSKDLEYMDASLLMQSDYIQPLHSSDLPFLTEHLFARDTIKKLKYFAARKVVQNRSAPQTSTFAQSPKRTGLNPALNRSTTAPSPSVFSQTPSQALINRSPMAITYGQAAVTDHKLREERLARVHLANWAMNLQRSLANERARYEAIARAERAEWLKARLGECVFEQDVIAPGKSAEREVALVQKNGSMSPQLKQAFEKHFDCTRSRSAFHDPADPLGLLRWRDDLGTNTLAILGVISQAGLVGVVGGFVFISIKNFTNRGGFDIYPSAFGNWWESFDQWIMNFSR